jgi:hypothetical protein
MKRFLTLLRTPRAFHIEISKRLAAYGAGVCILHLFGPGTEAYFIKPSHHIRYVFVVGILGITHECGKHAAWKIVTLDTGPDPFFTAGFLDLAFGAPRGRLVAVAAPAFMDHTISKICTGSLHRILIKQAVSAVQAAVTEHLVEFVHIYLAIDYFGYDYIIHSVPDVKYIGGTIGICSDNYVDNGKGGNYNGYVT